MTAIAESTKALLVSAADRAARANERDTEYWTTAATGQDSEEAEWSGTLNGMQTALEAVRDAVLLGQDEKLAALCTLLRSEEETFADKIELLLAEDDPEEEAVVEVTLRVYGASEALAQVAGWAIPMGPQVGNPNVRS